MAFVTKLLIDEKEIEVISYRFGFKKQVNEQSRPTTLASFNGLEIEIESTQNSDFEEWMKSEKPKSKIQLQIFYPYLEGGSKIMTFYDCYLIGFQTIFSNNNYEPMKDRLRITSGGVKAPYSSIEYTTSWRKTFDNQSDNEYRTPIKEIEDKAPRVIDYYLTNKKDEKIENAELEEYVYLNIKTKNLIGYAITINLYNSKVDYKLNGKILKNDILKNYQLKNDFEKIELEIIEQKQKK